MKTIDMTGMSCGRLTVVGRAGSIDGRAIWRAVCSCGNTTTVMGKDLRRGHSQSCGCLQRERASEANSARSRQRKPRGECAKKHPLYATWRHMRRRCSSPADPDYQLYGARGIRVCEQWASFWIFAADMGERPPGTTIDRIDPDGNYEPGNCRWATPTQQAQNTRRSRLPKDMRQGAITFRGETRTTKEWAQKLGLHQSAISHRLRNGWDVERAFTTPKMEISK